MQETSEVTQENNQKNSAEKLSGIIGVVCSVFNIAPKDITNKEDRAFLVPRQVTAYFLKTAGGQTLKTIRETLGLVVDGQVYQYCARVKQLSSADARVREKFEKIRTELGCDPDHSPVTPTIVPAVLKTAHRGRPKKSEQTSQKTPTPKKVLAVIGNIYCTPALLVDPEAVTTIALARLVAVFILWKECQLSTEKIADLLKVNEERIYIAFGKASMALESKDEPFGQALALVRSKL